jgi:hypothetical protein
MDASNIRTNIRRNTCNSTGANNSKDTGKTKDTIKSKDASNSKKANKADSLKIFRYSAGKFRWRRKLGGKLRPTLRKHLCPGRVLLCV